MKTTFILFSISIIIFLSTISVYSQNKEFHFNEMVNKKVKQKRVFVGAQYSSIRAMPFNFYFLPEISFRLGQKIHLGLGENLGFFYDTSNGSSFVLGARAFTRYFITNEIFLQNESDISMINTVTISNETVNIFVPEIFLGIGYKMKFRKIFLMNTVFFKLSKFKKNYQSNIMYSIGFNF